MSALRSRGNGFTIIEFMIAMTLSLMVLAALTGAFVANSRARTEIERANQQMENGRFALQLLTDDLQLAGYLSHFNARNASSLSLPGTKPNPCATTIAAIDAALLLHVQGYDDAGSLSACGTLLADLKAGTDIVVVRRTATCVVGTPNCAAVAGAPYFQASLCGDETELGASDNDATRFYDLDSNTGNLTRRRRDCTTRAELRQYLTHIYFVANNDQASDKIPTLKRAELGGAGGNPAFSVVSLAHGIEDLQVEYGIDTGGQGVPWSGDGVADVYTASPDTYARGGCPGDAAACVRNWGDVMSVRLHILARNTEPSQDYVDDKIYTLGLDAAGNERCALDSNNDGTCEAFNDSYKRHVYGTSVRLTNPSGRRL